MLNFHLYHSSKNNKFILTYIDREEDEVVEHIAIKDLTNKDLKDLKEALLSANI